MKSQLQDRIRDAIVALQESGALPAFEVPTIVLERPKQDAHGDFATNVAMVMAGRAKRKPRDIAVELIAKLGDAGGLLSRAEVAGPGFVNFFVAPVAWQASLGDVLSRGERFGRLAIGAGKRVLLEYVSANPTGPLHVGHGRQAAVGDAIARLLRAAGYDVHREYYINDAGNQVTTLGRSVYARYREALGLAFEFPEDGYPGEYVRDIARHLVGTHGADLAKRSDDEAIAECARVGASMMVDVIRTELERFDAKFDRWFSEKEMVARGDVDVALARLREASHLYERDGALWFRSEALGDEKDRVVVKADGSRTYFASDIAYHFDKLERGFDRCIDVWGADHHGYVPRMTAAIAALGHEPSKFQVVLVQFVNLIGGRMGKRSGNMVTFKDLIDEVGVDAARFFYLLRSQNNTFDFDLQLAKEQTPENPVFYVQYGHARICQLIERARAEGIAVPAFSADAVAALELPEELALIRAILQFPEVVAVAAQDLEPHRVAFYLQELLALFHGYYTKYKKTERVVSSDVRKTGARLLLCDAMRLVIRNGLAILGVSAPTRMEAPPGDDE